MMTTRQRSAKQESQTVVRRERLPTELSQVNLNAAGIDVGASSHFVAVSADRAERPVQEFAAFTADLYRLDLTRIDGVDGFWSCTGRTPLKVISEIGTDMTKWESAKHFASWLGLSPNNRITGGRVISSKTKTSGNRAAKALRLAANALHRSNSPLGTFLRRKKAHLGAPKAITATAHKLARIIYSMLRYGQGYVDAGAQYYESQYRQRALRAAKQRAAQLGYRLVPIADAHDLNPVPSTTTAATAA